MSLTLVDRFGDTLTVESHGWEDKENWVSFFARYSADNVIHGEVEVELSPAQVNELIAYLKSTQEEK